MNKALLTILLLVPVSSFAAGKIEGCMSLSALSGRGAEARDTGIPQSQYFQTVLKAVDENGKGLSEDERDLLIAIASVAYLMPEARQAEIEREVFSVCIESVK